MSKKYTFRLNLPGLNQLMKSAPMQSALNSAANSISAMAGDGFETESAHPISFIAIASVGAATYEARKNNSDNNTLLKAVGSTRV